MRLLTKFALLLVLTFGACAMPIEPATDSDPQVDEAAEIDGIKQDSWCFGFPFRTMAFPQNQGAWKGDQAGQWMQAPFWNNHCPVLGEEYNYAQDDGQINLLQNVGWSPNTCWTWQGSTGSGIVCNNQTFQCPASACLTLPAAWQLEAAPPLNAIIWDWVNPTESAAPGRHGIWPKTSTQCSTGVAIPQFNPNGSGGTLLNCKYSMPNYKLKQF